MKFGDWILIENLHLAQNWLFELDMIIKKMQF
jgi:hypothetical protein